MNDDVVKIILSKLDKIELKQDDQETLLRSISERIAKLEQRQDTYDAKLLENEKALKELETVKNEGVGAKNVVGWLITVVISVIALFESYYK